VIDGGSTPKPLAHLPGINHKGRWKKTTKTGNAPDRNDNNDPGCPIFIRRDHCAVSLSMGNSSICLGRSSDFPSPSAAFPPDISYVFIPKISGSFRKKHKKHKAVAYHAEAVFPFKIMEKRITAAGPSPIFTEFPVRKSRKEMPYPHDRPLPDSLCLQSTQTILTATLSTIFLFSQHIYCQIPITIKAIKMNDPMGKPGSGNSPPVINTFGEFKFDLKFVI